MTIKELYEKIGGKFEDVQGRLVKDSLIEKFALMYLKDPSFDNLKDAVSKGNIPDSFRAVHSLKGVASNLGFEELRVAASNLTEQLRPQTSTADPSLLEAVKKVHEKVVNGLKEYQNG